MFIIGITGPSGAGKTTALRVLEEMGGQVYDCDAIYHELLASDGELLAEIEAAFPGAVQDGTLDRKALGAKVFADPEGLRRLTEITQPLVKRRVLERIRATDTTSSVIRRAGDAGCHLPLKGKALTPVPAGSHPPSAIACCLLPVASEEASASGGRPMAAPTGFAVGSDALIAPVIAAGNDAAAGQRRRHQGMPPYEGFAVIDAIGLFESGLGAECDLTAAVVADEETRVRRLMARDGITEEYARSRIAAQKPAAWFAERADLVLENNGSEAEFAERCRRAFAEKLQKGDFMREYTYISLLERPELEREAAAWFRDKWGVPEEAYLECMDAYLSGETELGWYLCLKRGGQGSGRPAPDDAAEEIVGGLGVIENDFHDRKDLSPNVCAVYTEPEHRGRGIAGRLLNLAVEDLRAKGISPVYLVTDHTGFYERYGWEFFCHAQGDGEDHLTRLYIHR